jgi:hypothetical protein
VKYIFRLGFLVLVLPAVLLSCATTESNLRYLSPGMSREAVLERLGGPEHSYRDGDKTIDVHDLYIYDMAIRGASPFYNSYRIEYLNDRMVGVEKITNVKALSPEEYSNFIKSVSRIGSIRPSTGFVGGTSGDEGGVGCGLRPIPEIGCKIGRCVNGSWEQLCGNCGIRPVPSIGCRIGRCVDGSWEQLCGNCGIRPIPSIGCRIGRCVDGSWEQICN